MQAMQSYCHINVITTNGYYSEIGYIVQHCSGVLLTAANDLADSTKHVRADINSGQSPVCTLTAPAHTKCIRIRCRHLDVNINQ